MNLLYFHQNELKSVIHPASKGSSMKGINQSVSDFSGHFLTNSGYIWSSVTETACVLSINILVVTMTSRRERKLGPFLSVDLITS